MIMIKYQTGIKEAVFKAVKESKKLKFEYITKKDIIRNVMQQGVHLSHPEAQIGQALYHLQLKTKYRRPLIKKYPSIFFLFGRLKLDIRIINKSCLWSYQIIIRNYYGAAPQPL